MTQDHRKYLKERFALGVLVAAAIIAVLVVIDKWRGP
jgi:hypothetical protein